MRILSLILLVVALAQNCPAPVTFPPSTFDQGNWAAVSTALNNSQTNTPTLGSDHGGRDYVAVCNTGFGCTAVSSNQFAIAAHIFPTGGPMNMGAVTFQGSTYLVTNRAAWNEFAIMTVDGVITNWCRIDTNTIPFYPRYGVMWGYGKGYKPTDPVYTNSGVYTVFPIQIETAALRWAYVKITSTYSAFGYTELRSIAYQDDLAGNGAVVGGDSGGPLFVLNTSTGKHELIGTHHAADSINNDPFVGTFGVHASAWHNRDAITAYLNAGDPPTNSVAPATPGFGTAVFERLSIGGAP